MIDYDRIRTERLATWLAERRWYGEKSRDVSGAETVFRGADPTSGRIGLHVVRLTFTEGEPADYLLLEDGSGADGIESTDARAWLAGGFAEHRVLRGHQGTLVRWSETVPGDVPWKALAGQSRVFRGEQSNTSVVYGDRAMLKVFRKVRAGVNPEVEIGEFLTAHTAFRAFPRLLGTVDLVVDGQVTTLAAMQAFVPSVGDAWGWLTERLEDAATRPETVDAAHVLGARTGEMHIAFASGVSDHFAPERATADHAESIRSGARRELRETMDLLEERCVTGAASLGEALEATLDALLLLEGTMMTRVHGDYHLGQVLRTSADDFAILDFEGEPTRSLTERRSKVSPLRDVAGMLRSFDYAAETARRAPGVHAGHIDSWLVDSRAAFLDGYGETVQHSDVLMRGWDGGHRDAVLAAYETHKALYEVRYEIGNRPDWLDIPLDALRRIAGVRGD